MRVVWITAASNCRRLLRVTPVESIASYALLCTVIAFAFGCGTPGEKGAFSTGPDSEYSREYPLQAAAESGDAEKLGELLSNGADLEAHDRNGRTALHQAAWGGQVKAIELLMAKGASLTAVTSNGMSPLHLAVMNGQAQAVEKLMELGADPEAVSASGVSVRSLANSLGNSAVIAALAGKGKG